jgi:hypothetical protein
MQSSMCITHTHTHTHTHAHTCMELEFFITGALELLWTQRFLANLSISLFFSCPFYPSNDIFIVQISQNWYL